MPGGSVFRKNAQHEAGGLWPARAGDLPLPLFSGTSLSSHRSMTTRLLTIMSVIGNEPCSSNGMTIVVPNEVDRDGPSA